MSETRGLAAQRVQELIDQAPLNARQAVQEGLVDAILYPDQVRTPPAPCLCRCENNERGAAPPNGAPCRFRVCFCVAVGVCVSVSVCAQVVALAKEAGGSQVIGLRKYAKSVLAKDDSAMAAFAGRDAGKPRIALITAVGTIVRGLGDPTARGPEIGADAVAAAVRRAYSDPAVRAIVVRVDSPGGSAVASDTIRRELERAREAGRPVVVSMAGVAASGGYYIATGADRVVAQPGTITGSIGSRPALLPPTPVPRQRRPSPRRVRSRRSAGIEGAACCGDRHRAALRRRRIPALQSGPG